MACIRAVLVLALLLSAAVAGRAQDAAAGNATSADQPQQAEGAAAAATDQPAADQAPEKELSNAAAVTAVEESASSGKGAADQPQPQSDLPAADGNPGADGQAEESKRVFTAEQLAELQQQIQHAIDLQRNHEQVGADVAAASPCTVAFKLVRCRLSDATLPAAPVVQVSEPIISQIVDEAPAAELASGDADVSTTGKWCRMLLLYAMSKSLTVEHCIVVHPCNQN